MLGITTLGNIFTSCPLKGSKTVATSIPLGELRKDQIPYLATMQILQA
jgi:hypothetical protein